MFIFNGKRKRASLLTSSIFENHNLNKVVKVQFVKKACESAFRVTPIG